MAGRGRGRADLTAGVRLGLARFVVGSRMGTATTLLGVAYSLFCRRLTASLDAGAVLASVRVSLVMNASTSSDERRHAIKMWITRNARGKIAQRSPHCSPQKMETAMVNQGSTGSLQRGGVPGERSGRGAYVELVAAGHCQRTALSRPEDYGRGNCSSQDILPTWRKERDTRQGQRFATALHACSMGTLDGGCLTWLGRKSVKHFGDVALGPSIPEIEKCLSGPCPTAFSGRMGDSMMRGLALTFCRLGGPGTAHPSPQRAPTG